MQSSTIILADEKRRAHALKIISSLALDELWSVQIDKYQPKRSSQANKRYWALMQLYADKTGYEAEELHEMLKAKFLAPKQIEVAGDTAMVRPSTAKLGSKVFAEYMDKVERWGIQTLGCWLE